MAKRLADFIFREEGMSTYYLTTCRIKDDGSVWRRLSTNVFTGKWVLDSRIKGESIGDAIQRMEASARGNHSFRGCVRYGGE